MGQFVSKGPTRSYYPWSSNCSDTLSKSVHVQLWELGEYLGHDAGVPGIIDPAWIKGQLALTTVSIGQDKAKVWATVDLAKVRHLYTIRIYIHTNPWLQ